MQCNILDWAKYGQNSSTLGSIVHLAMFSILIFGSFHLGDIFYFLKYFHVGLGLAENILFQEEISLGVEN